MKILFIVNDPPYGTERVSGNKQGGTPMPTRPDPTFHASPKLAMEAPPENFAYTLLLSPDFSKPRRACSDRREARLAELQ